MSREKPLYNVSESKKMTPPRQILIPGEKPFRRRIPALAQKPQRGKGTSYSGQQILCR